MQLDPGFIATMSAQNLVAFSIALFILILNYWAATRIIRQAGYSSAWIVVPLAPLVITVASMVVAYKDLNALVRGVPIGFFGANGLSVLWRLDELSGLVVWLFFLIFAFSKWPVLNRPMAPKDSGQRRQPPSAPLKGVGASRSTTSRSNPTSSPSPRDTSVGTSTDLGEGGRAAPQSAAVGQRKATYCGWCGESTPGNRGLSHDCGPKDRPMTSCRFCGKPFAQGADSCSECFA
jgi:hypothetical protein